MEAMSETDVYSAMTEGDLLALIYDKPQPLVIETTYTCNGSPQGCERERFGHCLYHDALPKPVCIACDDTGKNSNGGDCVPCTLRKRNETCRK